MGLFDFFKRKHVNRGARVHLSALHNIHFTKTHPQPQQDLELVNISPSGLAFLKKSSKSWPKAGETLEGIFRFETKTHPQTLKIVRVTDALVGCHFEGDSSKIQKLIQEYFHAEIAGLNMIQVNSAILKLDPEGTPYWYSGRNNCSMYFVENEGEIVRFYISFFANYLESNQAEPLKLYQVEEDAPFERPKYKASEVLSKDVIIGTAIPQNLIETVIRFVENIPNLSTKHRKWILDKIHQR